MTILIPSAEPCGWGTLLVNRIGYYVRAARSAQRILAAVARYGTPRIVIARDRDFGNIVDRGRQSEQSVVGLPGISAALAAARRHGTFITIVGAGHSGAGQTLSRRGIRLKLDTAPGEAAIWHDEVRLEVPGTWRWHEVEAAANSRGRTIPVLTDNLDTTVGGTLSVGGIGTRSVSYGRQVDWVDALTLIRPDGTIVLCSLVSEPDLFVAALAGLGQVGVIGSVVIETVPLRPWVASLVYQIASLDDAAQLINGSLSQFSPPPTHFEVVGPQIGSRYIHLRLGCEAESEDAAARLLTQMRQQQLGIISVLRTARVMTTAAFAQVNVRHVQTYVASLKGASHLWNDWFFTDPVGYRQFVAWVERVLLPRLGTHDLVAGFLLNLARRPGRPHLPLSYAADDSSRAVGHIGLYYSVSPREADRRETICRGLAEAQLAARDCGGRLYLYGWHDRKGADWRAEFGPDYDRVLALKRQLDPDFLLNSEVLVAA
jgi:FAD/FMN-containing dehydrogenase